MKNAKQQFRQPRNGRDRDGERVGDSDKVRGRDRDGNRDLCKKDKLMQTNHRRQQNETKRNCELDTQNIEQSLARKLIKGSALYVDTHTHTH